jgi:AbrB family looped-hinge helix DNA binding protein
MGCVGPRTHFRIIGSTVAYAWPRPCPAPARFPCLFREWYSLWVSGTYQVVMGDRGRLVIPADLRERAGLAEGTALILLETPTGLVLLTRPQLQGLVRADLAGLDLVGELLAERRAEAAADDAA